MAFRKQRSVDFFQNVPKNADGQMTIEEMRKHFLKYGYNLTETDVKAEGIVSGDKMIYDQFDGTMDQRPKDIQAKMLRKAFATCDPNGTGQINKKDLKKIKDDVAPYLSEADMDRLMALGEGTGKLNYEDFIAEIVDQYILFRKK